MSQPTVGYECNGCGTVYQDEDCATHCCKPQMCSAFACSKCHNLFRTQRGADNCCQVKEGLPNSAVETICNKCKRAYLSSGFGKQSYCPECREV